MLAQEHIEGKYPMVIEIGANATAVGRPLKHSWSLCVGAGRANEGLRANWLEQMKLAHDTCGFRYVRFHGLFHDDMFVYRELEGVAHYNFQYIDELFDRLLQLGVRPFVEFGFCPRDLATVTDTVFWWKGHGSPPKQYAAWGQLITRCVQHWVNRYGLSEVRQWYFEVWNEPNLKPFFSGKRSEYFELYKVTAQAVKAVDVHLRVGGPATSNFVPDARFDGEMEDISCHKTVTKAEDLDALNWKPVWLEAFFQFCRHKHLPVDFVSCHPYPTDWPLDEYGVYTGFTRGVDATPADLRTVRKIVDASAYPHAEIHLTEWSSSSSPRDNTHDFLQAATYVVKANLESANLVDSLSYWTFTDVFEEGGAGNTAFHGGFGMINYQGIVKPTFHAYRFLNRLGNQIIAQQPGSIVTRHQHSGRVTALAYHYPAEMKLSIPASMNDRGTAQQILAMGQEEQLNLHITGLPPGASVVVETLDVHHGDAISAWFAMGEPDPLSPMQETHLRQSAQATARRIVQVDPAGTLTYRQPMGPWSLVLVDQIV
jgi:xylan 1,4-beta-xylosidase